METKKFNVSVPIVPDEDQECSECRATVHLVSTTNVGTGEVTWECILCSFKDITDWCNYVGGSVPALAHRNCDCQTENGLKMIREIADSQLTNDR